MASFGNGSPSSPLIVPEVGISASSDGGWGDSTGFGAGPMASMPPDVPGMNNAMVNMRLGLGHALAIGHHFSGLTGLPVQANYTPAQIAQNAATVRADFATMAAVADLTADVLAGTVPPHDLAILTSAHVPLQFIGSDTLQVGAGASAWNYHAPTPFVHTDPQAAGYAGFTSTVADWGVMVTTAITIAGGVASIATGGAGVPVLIGVAGALAGAAFSGSYSRVAHDMAWGVDMFAAHGNINQASSMMAGAPL